MFREFELERDLDEVNRVWQECGWLEGSQSDTEGLRAFLSGVFGVVAELNDCLEVLASVRMGTLRYEEVDLPSALVASVNVGRVARGRRLGGQACAMAVAEAVRRGAAVVHLGMFDQGFYDKLGFGSGPHHRMMTIRPADLLVDVPQRVPVRLTKADAERCHRSRQEAMRRHGGLSFFDPGFTRSEMLWSDKGFGLGFEDEHGTLTHHLWMRAKGENGPYSVQWLAYRSWAELRELLGLIKSLRDQVYAVRIVGLPGVQLQDFLRRPIAHMVQSRGSSFDQKSRAFAWWQARILDLSACISAVTVYGPPIRFRLNLTDPIARYLPPDAPWRGLAGSYDVELSENTHIGRAGSAPLPELSASVGALSRLWLGVQSASGLSASDDLSGPPALLAALDRRLRPPLPVVDCDL